MTTLTRLRELLAAATPGPWEHHNWDKMEAPHVVAPSLWDGKSSCNGSFDVPCTYANAALIAAAVNALPALLRVAEAATHLSFRLAAEGGHGHQVHAMNDALSAALAALEGGTHE